MELRKTGITLNRHTDKRVHNGLISDACQISRDPRRASGSEAEEVRQRHVQAKFMSLLSMEFPIENLSIITFDSWLSKGRG